MNPNGPAHFSSPRLLIVCMYYLSLFLYTNPHTHHPIHFPNYPLTQRPQRIPVVPRTPIWWRGWRATCSTTGARWA